MTRSTTSHTAAMTEARVLDLRHTAPTVRDGAGLANRRMVRPRCEPNGDSTASSGSNVTQSLETGRAKIFGFTDVDAAANLERLVAQTVPVLEQQQCLPLQILHLDARFRAEGVIVRQRNGEILHVKLARLDAVVRGGERHQPHIDFAV